jgi:DUF1680 family protein
VIADRRAAERLQQLLQLAERELAHLLLTDQRLFSKPFTTARALQLETDPDLAERVDAFVARFGHLQDTLGDIATFIDNLDRAERLGLIRDAQQWMDIRKLRNLMIHEYVEDPAMLASALQAAHDFVAELAAVVERLRSATS